MRGEPFKVYFACVGNSARSQMAEGFARALGGDAVEVRSGGSRPAGVVSSKATQAMEERGIDISGYASEPLDEAFAREADVVVTMGCGEREASSEDRPERSEDGPKGADACPAFREREVVDWPLDDPKDLDMAGVRRVRDEIEERVRGLLSEGTNLDP